MWMRTIWMEYADNGEIAISDMGSGRAVGFVSVGAGSNKERLGDVEARLFWDETAVDSFRA
jgi:hypothetical protein